MKLIKVFMVLAVLFINLQAKEKVNINISNLSVYEFIKFVAKVTHKNILVNYPIKGKVDFISNQTIYDSDLMEILVLVLDAKGYTLVEKGAFLSVVRSGDATKYATKVVKKGKKLLGNLMVTQAIKVPKGNIDVIASKIRYLLSRTAKLITLRDANNLIITDYPANIKRIKQVIQELKDSDDFLVEVISIQNTEAKALQVKLDTIVKTLFNAKIATDVVRVIVDDGLNALVLVGIKDNILKIKKIIQKLDKESNASNSVKIFSLKNSDAVAVVKSLNEIISKQQFKDPSLKPNISASNEINAVIAVGDPLILKGIKKIIDELDKEKYQVYVQANIIEINKSDAKSLGIKYGFDGAVVGSNGGLYALSTNFAGVNFGLDNLLSSITTNGLNSGFALNMAIDFLQTKGVATSVSNPSILCVNNKQSSIYVGKTISIVNGSVANNSGGVGTGVTNSYKREDVGLTLKIKPRVSSNEKVTLEVEAILESVLDDGSNNATGQPVTSKQTVKTQAILRHGESIIIGGLIKSYERKAKTKVPLLGDIPWLGEFLFSSTETTTENDNLVVILTPYVIDQSSQLSKLQKELGILTNIQKEYEQKIFAKIEETKQIDVRKHFNKHQQELKLVPSVEEH